METPSPLTQNGLTQDRIWGDTDCGGTIDLGDAIKIDRALIDLPITTFASARALNRWSTYRHPRQGSVRGGPNEW